MEIREKTTVDEAIKKSREVAKVLKKYNLDCAGCRGAKEDTIEKIAINNGLNVKDLLRELNQAAK
jgi:hybrid cluster-associated redox disulfide protein